MHYTNSAASLSNSVSQSADRAKVKLFALKYSLSTKSGVILTNATSRVLVKWDYLMRLGGPAKGAGLDAGAGRGGRPQQSPQVQSRRPPELVPNLPGSSQDTQAVLFVRFCLDII